MNQKELKLRCLLYIFIIFFLITITALIFYVGDQKYYWFTSNEVLFKNCVKEYCRKNEFDNEKLYIGSGEDFRNMHNNCITSCLIKYK